MSYIPILDFVLGIHICKMANGKDQGFIKCNKQVIISMYIVMYLQFDNKMLNVTGSLALGRKDNRGIILEEREARES